jgi:uncharacterized protein YbjT (DUF2867 family)
VSERGPILVFGGTGHYGRNIVKSLVDNGEPVRVMSRNPGGARETLGNQPEVVQGDITSADSRVAALKGVRAVVVAVSAFTWKMCRHRRLIERDSVLELLEDAERGGVSRIVYLSGYDVREESAAALGVTDFARPMLDVQAALAQSSLNWTVLGCAPSMDIFFSMIRGRVMNVPGGGPPKLPTISALDVGTIAAQSVVREDLGGQRFRVTGQEALSFPEAAKRIGDVWGWNIGFRRIPLAPLRIASIVTRPFSPFVKLLLCALTMLNKFPEELASEVPKDHQRLVDTFELTPTTLEDEARRRVLPA